MKKHLLFTLFIACTALFTQAQNLLSGSEMEDESAWTVIEETNSSDANSISYGVSTSSLGSGKAFYFDVITDAASSNNSIQYLVYQQVTLTIGKTYQFDAKYRNVSSDNATTSGGFWAEFRIGYTEPVEGSIFNYSSLIALNSWDGCGINSEGTYLADACKSDIDKTSGNYLYTVSDTLGTAGSEITAYVGIDMGSWSSASIEYSYSFDDLSLTEYSISSIDQTPADYSLKSFPNPVIGQAEISFNLEKASNVELSVYNISGSKVATIIANERMNAGSYTKLFDAENLTSGLYLCTINVDGVTQTKKMTISK